MKLTVTIENPSHVAWSGQFGASNLRGHALFSDGKRYRFRYATTTPEVGHGPYADGHWLTLWVPETDGRRERAICSPKRAEALIEEIVRVSPDVITADAKAEAERTAERDRRWAVVMAWGHQRDAGPALVEAATMALALIEDMSRFVGKMALQDYEHFNMAPILLTRALAAATGEGQRIYQARTSEMSPYWQDVRATSAKEAARVYAYGQQDKANNWRYYTSRTQRAVLDDAP